MCFCFHAMPFLGGGSGRRGGIKKVERSTAFPPLGFYPASLPPTYRVGSTRVLLSFVVIVLFVFWFNFDVAECGKWVN